MFSLRKSPQALQEIAFLEFSNLRVLSSLQLINA